MLLRDYLKKIGESPYVFGAKHGIAPPLLYTWCNGKRRMSSANAVKIEQLTNGEVDRREALWPEEYFEDKQ